MKTEKEHYKASGTPEAANRYQLAKSQSLNQKFRMFEEVGEATKRPSVGLKEILGGALRIWSRWSPATLLEFKQSRGAQSRTTALPHREKQGGSGICSGCALDISLGRSFGHGRSPWSKPRTCWGFHFSSDL